MLNHSISRGVVRGSYSSALAATARRPSPSPHFQTIRSRFHSSHSASHPRPSQTLFKSVATSLVAGVALTYYLAISSPLHGQAAQPNAPIQSELTQQDQMKLRAKNQGVYAWGSNRYNVVAPDAPQITLVRSPRSIPYFDGLALRDIVLEEKHGVAVDANGDVLQWGLGFFHPDSHAQTAIEDIPLGRRRERSNANQQAPIASVTTEPMPPVKTLVGKNIIKVSATEDKVFALSKNGQIYVFSAIQEKQRPSIPASWSANPLSLFGLLNSSSINHEVLSVAPASPFGRGEAFSDIVNGSNHLLALSNKGRTFSMPLNDQGNSFGQLGVRKVFLNAPNTSGGRKELIEAVLEPKMFLQLEAEQSGATPVSTTSQPTLPAGLSSGGSESIRFSTTLVEIPALRGVRIAQIAAGTEHSLARTHDGRVLAWGRQTHGQLGLGAQVTLECVPVPSEVVLSKSFPSSSVDVKATSIAAGGENSFFMTTRREPGAIGTGLKIDLLAAGKGQWGTLGNAMWSQVASQPGRVKTVSGLMEYSESTNATHPVPIYSISIGKPGHVALVLDTVEAAGHAAFGRDVMVWGANAAFQLGTGKRSNLAVPQHLKPLPPPTKIIGFESSDVDPLAAPNAKLREADINSGALTHMPHNRLQLASKTTEDTKTLPETNGSPAQVKKKQKIEESIKAGTVSTVVFWKVDP